MSRRCFARQGIYMPVSRQQTAVRMEPFTFVSNTAQDRNTESIKAVTNTSDTNIDRTVIDKTDINKELRDKQVTDTDTQQDVRLRVDASTDTLLSTTSKTTSVDRSIEQTKLDSKNILTNLVACDINIEAAQGIRDKLIVDRSKQLNLNVSQLVGIIGSDNVVDNVVLSNIVNSIGDTTKRNCVQNVVNTVESQNKLLAEETNMRTGDALDAGSARAGAARVDTSRETDMRARNESQSAFSLKDVFSGVSNYLFGTETKQEAVQTGQITSTQEASGSAAICIIL